MTRNVVVCGGEHAATHDLFVRLASLVHLHVLHMLCLPA
jgi:hypothetical protein